MDEDVIVREIVKSLAFEIEATNENNVLKWTSTNGTPLSVKVRVRNPDEPRLVQKGPFPIPRIGITAPDRLRLVSSDQTILSFNIYLDKEAQKQEEYKRSKLFQLFNIGGCLGTISDDDGPYLPSSSNQKAITHKSSSRSETAIIDTPHTVPAQNVTKKWPFGRCKRGGCLDPPFGEDKYHYAPSKTDRQTKLALEIRELEKKQASGSVDPTFITEKLHLKAGSNENNQQKLATALHEVEQKKEIHVDHGASEESRRKSKERSLQCRSSVHMFIKDEVDSKKLTDIYARKSRENSLITYHIDTSSTESLYGRIPNPSIKSHNESQRQTYEYPESYFVPPKDVLRYKEEERRYSKEPSNYQIGVSDLPTENDITDKTNVAKAIVLEHKPISQNARGSKDINVKKLKLTLTELQPNNVDVAQKIIEDKILPTRLAFDSKKPVSYISTDSKNIDDHKNVPHTTTEADFNTTAKNSMREQEVVDYRLQKPKKLRSGNDDAANIEANSNIQIKESTIEKPDEIILSSDEMSKPLKLQTSSLTDSNVDKFSEVVKINGQTLDEIHVSYPNKKSSNDQIGASGKVEEKDITDKSNLIRARIVDQNPISQNARQLKDINMQKIEPKSAELQPNNIDFPLNVTKDKASPTRLPSDSKDAVSYISTDSKNIDDHRNVPHTTTEANFNTTAKNGIREQEVVDYRLQKPKILRSGNDDVPNIEANSNIPIKESTVEKPDDIILSSDEISKSLKIQSSPLTDSNVDTFSEVVKTNGRSLNESHVSYPYKVSSNDQIGASGKVKKKDITDKSNLIRARIVDQNPISQNARRLKDINMQKIEPKSAELQPNNIDFAQKVTKDKVSTSPTRLPSDSKDPVSYIPTDSKNIDDHRNVPDKILLSGNVNIANIEADTDIPIKVRTTEKLDDIVLSSGETNKPIKSQASPLSDFNIKEFPEAVKTTSQTLDKKSNTYSSTTKDKIGMQNNMLLDTTDLYSDKRNTKDKPHKKPSLPESRTNVVKLAGSSYQDVSNVSSEADQTFPKTDLHKNLKTDIYTTPSADIETKKSSDKSEVVDSSYMKKEYSQNTQYELNDFNIRLPRESKTIEHDVSSSDKRFSSIPAQKLVVDPDQQQAIKQDFESTKQLELNKVSNRQSIPGSKNVEETVLNNDNKTTLYERSKIQPQITKHKPNMNANEHGYATLNAVQRHETNVQSEKSKNFTPSRKSSYENKEFDVSSTHSIDFMKHLSSNELNDEVDTLPKKQTSAILQKTPFIPRHDLDIHDNDINKSTQLKRQTFTIIGSDTSLSKQEEIEETPKDVTNIYPKAKDQAHNKQETLNRSNKEPENIRDLTLSSNQTNDLAKTPENNKDMPGNITDLRSIITSDRHGLLGDQNRDESDTGKTDGNKENNNKLNDVSSGNLLEKPVPNLHSKDTDYDRASPSTQLSGKAETLSTNTKDFEKRINGDSTIDSIISQKHVQESIKPLKCIGNGKSGLSSKNRDNAEVVSSDLNTVRNTESDKFSLTSENHDKIENVTKAQEKIKFEEITTDPHESIPENIEYFHSKMTSEDMSVPVFPIIKERELSVSHDGSDLGSSENFVQENVKDLYAHVTDDGKLTKYMQNRDKSESLSTTSKLMENKTYSSTAKDTSKKSIPKNENYLYSKDIHHDEFIGVVPKSDATEKKSYKEQEDKIKLEDAKYNNMDGEIYTELGATSSPKLVPEIISNIAQSTDDVKYFIATDSNQSQIKNPRENSKQSDVSSYYDNMKAPDETEFTKNLADRYSKLSNKSKSVSEKSSPDIRYSGLISEVLSNISVKAEEERFTKPTIDREATLGRDRDLIQTNTEVTQNNELLGDKFSPMTKKSIPTMPIIRGSNIDFAPKLHDNVYKVPKNTLENTEINRDSINKTVTEAFENVEHVIDDSDQVKQKSNDYRTIIKKPIYVDRNVPFNNISDISDKPTDYRSSDVTISVNDNIELNRKSFDTKPFLYIRSEEQKERTSPSLQVIKESGSQYDISYLDMSFCSYINDDNQRVVQTYNPPNEQQRGNDATVTVVKTLIRHGNEIRIPVDKENDLTLNIVDKHSRICNADSTIGAPPRYPHREHHIVDHVKNQDVLTKNLALIYESGLIPLHNVIKDLTKQVNNLKAKQEILQELKRSAKRTKSLRLIPVVKRCGCKRI